jgi:hypothetical protein
MRLRSRWRQRPATCRSHRKGGDGSGLFQASSTPIDSGATRLRPLPLLEDRSVLKVGQNLKYDW